MHEIDVFSPQACPAGMMRVQYSEGINFDWLNCWKRLEKWWAT